MDRGAGEAMRYLTTATSRPEAEMIRMRLRAAGIMTVTQGLAYTAYPFATRDIYVDEKDFDSARALLKGSEDISESELVEAEEADAAARAARHPMPPRAGDALQCLRATEGSGRDCAGEASSKTQ